MITRQEVMVPIINHGAGGVFVRRDPKGQVSVLAHTYTRKGRTTLRLPAGTGQPRESVWATLRREMYEEVAAPRSDDFEFRLVFPHPVYFNLCRDDRTRKLTYLKVFFIFQITHGAPRDVTLIDDEGTPEAEILGPLRWYDIGSLVPRLTLRVHQCAVAATLLLLAQSNVALRSRYQHTWSRWERHTTQLQIKDPVVTEYVTRAFSGT